VTVLDWIILAAALAAGIRGALRGFVVGALSLAGFLAGAWIGARFAPLLLDEGSSSPWAPVLALVGALAIGASLSLTFEFVARRLRGEPRLTPGGVLDGLLGAGLGAATALVIVWIAGAIALQTPGLGDLRREVQRSTVLATLNDALPPSGPILSALARFDPLPAISGPPTGDVPAPRRGILADPDVRAAAGGTVRILGAACGLGVTGSGWVAAPGIVVTNAHVVAGTDGDLLVQARGSGERLGARALAFDPRDDLAVLAVPGLEARVLPIASRAPEGASGAILGFPRNGPFDARPARIGVTRSVVSQDAYGRGPVTRPMTALRGLLRPGNSGGPVVDAQGRVMATVFASSVSGPPGGYAVPNGILRELLAGVRADGPTVGTGPCTA
jgi:hypothetical protein